MMRFSVLSVVAYLRDCLGYAHAQPPLGPSVAANRTRSALLTSLETNVTFKSDGATDPVNVGNGRIQVLPFPVLLVPELLEVR